MKKSAKSKRHAGVRILFVASDIPTAAAFADELVHLAWRGYTVEAAIESGSPAELDKLARKLPGVAIGPAPSERRRFEPLAGLLRSWLDYSRLPDQTDPACKPRLAAVEARVPRLARALARRPQSDAIRQRVTHLVAAMERSIPPDPAICEFLERKGPALLIVAPLFDIAAGQTDYLRAARRIGVRTLVPVVRWDQLGLGGSMHERPDWLAVWNRHHRQAASRLHGMPPQFTVVLGVPSNVQGRAEVPEEAARPVGMTQPLFVYQASDRTDEQQVQAIRQWVRAIRSGEDRLVQQATLAVSLGGGADQDQVAAELAAWTRKSNRGAITILRRGSKTSAASGLDARAALDHATAVVAVNVAGALAAALAGQAVFLPPTGIGDDEQGELDRFKATIGSEDVWLQQASDWTEHLAQLARVATDEAMRDRLRHAARDFARPHGPDISPAVALAHHVVDEILAAAPGQMATERESSPTRLASWALKLANLVALAVHPSLRGGPVVTAKTS